MAVNCFISQFGKWLLEKQAWIFFNCIFTGCQIWWYWGCHKLSFFWCVSWFQGFSGPNRLISFTYYVGQHFYSFVRWFSCSVILFCWDITVLSATSSYLCFKKVQSILPPCYPIILIAVRTLAVCKIKSVSASPLIWEKHRIWHAMAYKLNNTDTVSGAHPKVDKEHLIQNRCKKSIRVLFFQEGAEVYW